MAEIIKPQEVVTLSWGLFLALALSAVLIAAGFPVGPIFLIGLAAVMIFAFRYIYLTFFIAVAFMPFLGITVSVPTGAINIGQRAFGGSIDVSLGEVFLFVVLGAWALKLIMLWRRRGDENWRPRFPLIRSYLCLFAAHLISAFSPLVPDPVLVVKYSLRPVFYSYLAFIALPVNLIRSRRRLITVLSVFIGVGILAALNGLVSIFFPIDGSNLVGRAHPYPIFGINALGENHNSLAELLVVTTPLTLALIGLVRHERTKRLLYMATSLQFVIGLLTFTRTGWIVFALQITCLLATVWRRTATKYISKILIASIFLAPLAVTMLAYSVSQTAQSSNSTRLALTQIAMQIFYTSPWVGGGAGTFVDRVGSTSVFLLEYGDPLDSHGFLQKLAAETGLVGLLGYAIVIAASLVVFWRGYKLIKSPVSKNILVFVVLAFLGSVVYQLFNTSYWTGRLWLPLGLLIATIEVFRREERKQ
ncbi:MAG: O-antigen ligase family protein [Patescibacteria group bacterium]